MATTDLQSYINRQGEKFSKGFFETIELDDGSLWIPICVHDVSLQKFFPTITPKQFTYVDNNIWSAFGLINTGQRPEEDYYEFYVVQQRTSTSGFDYYRWKQTVNPFNATWSDVNPSKRGTTVINVLNTSGGMYWMNNSYVAMCFADWVEGHWYGCGIKRSYDQGIPGYMNKTVQKLQMTFMRIANSEAKEFKSSISSASQFTEYKELEDGSLWVPIISYYVPDGKLFNGESTSEYINSNTWSAIGLINTENRPDNDWYEFMSLEQKEINSNFVRRRWKQNINPLNASWEQVNNSKIGTNIIQIENCSPSVGGIYYGNNSMTLATGLNVEGYWYGFGARRTERSKPGYEPGYMDWVGGWQLLYMRVDNASYKIFKGGRANAAKLNEE